MNRYMKWVFYLSALLWIAFEVCKVYFIMPFPGSQASDSVGWAYFLHDWRWILRGFLWLMLAWGFVYAIRSSKWWPLFWLLLGGVVFYMGNFQMSAEVMFRLPNHFVLQTAADSKVPLDQLVIGVAEGNEAHAYPLAMIAYHHQVYDTVGGKAVMVTYCNVCRTGRVFEPVVEGKPERFRLVGMDHFNAMFEDSGTKTWWRQVNGEAVAGKLKGQFLPEVPALQVTLSEWLALYPQSQILQFDPDFQKQYDALATYERGHSKGNLTRRDSASWERKSWVLGLRVGDQSRAYDWNALARQRILNDTLNRQPIALVLAPDSISFYAFRRSSGQEFRLRQDTLWTEQGAFRVSGKSLQDSVPDLKRIQAYQEYWHSWQTFNPKTTRFPN